MEDAPNTTKELSFARMRGHRKSYLQFRIQIPEMSTKASQYPHQYILVTYARKYFSIHYPSARPVSLGRITFQEIYDGAKYLQFSVPLGDGKGERKIILVEN